jgi:hypothetical protein
MVALALFISAIALFSFLEVAILAKIVQLSSWTMATLIIAGFLLIASGGFVASSIKRKK